MIKKLVSIVDTLRNILWRVSLISLSFLITCLVLEIVIRTFMPQQLIILRSDIWTPSNNGRGWQHQANIDTTINTGERNIRLLTDENGYRIDPTQLSSISDIKILALGDSFLAALQVNYEDIITSRLERQLSSDLEKTVTFVNTGVDGYSPNQYRVVAKQELERVDYDMVITFVYVGNDIIINNSESLQPRQPSVIQTLKLPQNLSRNELTDSIFYPINDFLERNSHLFIFVKARLSTLLARFGLTAYYITSAVKTEFSDVPHWENTANILSDIQEETAKYDIPMMVVLIPTSYQINEDFFAWYKQAFKILPNTVDINQPSVRFAEEIANVDVFYYDMTEVLRGAYQQQVTDLYGSISHHFGINGHKVIADQLRPHLLQILQSIDS